MGSRIRMDDWHADGPYAKRTKYVVPGQLLADAVQIATGAEAKDSECLLRNGCSVHPVRLSIKDMKVVFYIVTYH